MRILIATDAWHPQVNGVVRTLTSLARSASALGAEIEFLTPDGFPSFELPTYPGLRVAWTKPARDRPQDRGGIAGRHSYRDRGTDRMGGARLLPSSQAGVHDVLYDALSGIHRGTLDHSGVAELCGAAAFSCGGRHDDGRHFVAQAGTQRKRLPKARQLDARGRHRTVPPDDPAELDLPRPIFMTVGRVAVEKNLEAFLALNLPGSKVVIGDGPQKAELEQPLPESQIPGRKNRPRSDLSSGGGRRLCLPEPHRHVRRRSTRGAGVWHACRGVSGHRSAGRDCGSPGWCSGHGLATRLHRRAEPVT